MSKEGPQKAQCPDNQLALGHLSQLAFRAQQQGNYIFRSAIIKAARSIADCPFPIVTVQDALSLNGVGKSLASDIVKWVGSKPTGLDSANEPAELPGKGGAQLEDTSSDSSQGKVQRHKRARYAIYRPERGKGPWLLLYALHLLNGKANKQQIMAALNERGLAHVQIQKDTVEQEMIVSNNLKTTDLDWWSNAVKQLINREMLLRTQPNTVKLTDAGLVIAQSLAEEENQKRRSESIDAPYGTHQPPLNSMQEQSESGLSLSQTMRVGFENIQIDERHRHERGHAVLAAPSISFERSNSCSRDDDDDDDFIPNRRRPSTAATTIPVPAKQSNCGAPVIIELLSPPPTEEPRKSYVNNFAEIVYSPISSSSKNNGPSDRFHQDFGTNSYTMSPSPFWGSRESGVGRVSEETVILELDDPWANESRGARRSYRINNNNNNNNQNFVVDLTESANILNPSAPDIQRKSAALSRMASQGSESPDPGIFGNKRVSLDGGSMVSSATSTPLSADEPRSPVVKLPTLRERLQRIMQISDPAPAVISPKKDSNNGENDNSLEIALADRYLPRADNNKGHLEDYADDSDLWDNSHHQAAGIVYYDGGSPVHSGCIGTSEIISHLPIHLDQRERDDKFESIHAENFKTSGGSIIEKSYQNSAVTWKSKPKTSPDKTSKKSVTKISSNMEDIQEGPAPAVSTISNNGEPFNDSDKPPIAAATTIRLPPGWYEDWEVVLLVDVREKENSTIQMLLMEQGVRCDTAQLAIGDFLWTAQRRIKIPEAVAAKKGKKKTQDSEAKLLEDWLKFDGVEDPFKEYNNANIVVLDCIVERKTAADLAASIIDGRYQEQKIRLQRCSCVSKIYIVEGLSLSMGRGKSFSRVTAQTLESAIVSTQVISSIHVQRTRGLDHTVSFLCSIHRRVTNRINSGGMSNHLSTLEQFQRINAKQYTNNMQQLLACQLKQIPSCSEDAAKTLARRFGTLSNLIKFVSTHGRKEDVAMFISEIKKDGGTHRRIGMKTASFIVQLFGEMW